jgi:hypothetical protein
LVSKLALWPASNDGFDENTKNIMESTTYLPWTNNSPFVLSKPVTSVKLGEINFDGLI